VIIHDDLRAILARPVVKKFLTLKKVQLCGLLWRPLCAECQYKPTHMKISCPLIPKKEKKKKNSNLNCHEKSLKFRTFINDGALYKTPTIEHHVCNMEEFHIIILLL
jgi:hypothetical protein